jgi:hypothetical protein
MLPVEFPAGVTTLLSRAAKISNWRDANLVRWEDTNTLRPVGGWEQVEYIGDVFASRVREIHRWTSLSGILYTAFLCEQHCYVEAGGTVTDITPVDGMAALEGNEAGYGELEYSFDAYGTARPGLSKIQKFSPAWTLDNWGEDLLAMTSYDGRLLRWSPSTPTTKLTAVPTAPISNRQFVVTPEHHCMLFQMGGNIADVGWCDEEDLEDWNFADIFNKAGTYTLDPFSPITAAQLSAQGILVFTPSMTHFIDYIGMPYIYRNRPMGRVPIPISASSTCAIPEGIAWISVEGFWLFNGSSADSIPCPIWDTISANMDFERTVREASVVMMQNRGEIWWFWVDSKIDLEPSRYVALDYRSNIWMPGYLKRTCGITYGNDKHPIMSDGHKIWKHEAGLVYPEARFMPYLESQTLNIAGGENWMTISKILPDIMGDRTALAFSVIKNNDRTVYPTQSQSPLRVANEHGWVDIRETARDIRLRIDMIRSADWRTIGPIIFDVKPRGKKR